MHPHEGHGDWREGPRVIVKGRRGPWFGPPWAGPEDDDPESLGPPVKFWRGRGGPFGPGGPAFWAAGGPGAGRGWRRARRGDVRSATLALLSERPMHGYEIITELSERTEGMWQPSPGSIYPTLQMLEDEGLVRAEAEGEAGRRRYSLTDEGRRAAGEAAAGPAPWEQYAAAAPAGARALRHAGRSLFAAVTQVAMAGGAEEHEQAVRILDEARRQLYAVLAAQQPAAGGPPPGD